MFSIHSDSFRPNEEVIVSNSGLSIELPNGYTVLVQWGPGTGSDNHCERPRGPDFEWQSTTAEVTVYTRCFTYSYKTWQTEEQVRAIIASVSELLSLEEEEEEEELDWVC